MLPPIGKSDHSLIICKLTPSESYRPPVVAQVLKCNESALSKVCFIEVLSEVRWECLYRAATCAEHYQIFEATISTLLEEYLPFRPTKHCTWDQPWVTDQFRNLILKCQQAFLQGNSALFHFYRNKTNREAKRSAESLLPAAPWWS